MCVPYTRQYRVIQIFTILHPFPKFEWISVCSQNILIKYLFPKGDCPGSGFFTSNNKVVCLKKNNIFGQWIYVPSVQMIVEYASMLIKWMFPKSSFPSSYCAQCYLYPLLFSPLLFSSLLFSIPIMYYVFFKQVTQNPNIHLLRQWLRVLLQKASL